MRLRRRGRTLEVTCLATSVAAASRSSGLSAAVSLERSTADIVDSACLRCNRVVQSVSAARGRRAVQAERRCSADANYVVVTSSRCPIRANGSAINRHFVKTLSRCPNLMTSAISRFRQCPRIITPFRGDSARRLVPRWGSRQEGGVVRHGDVRHQVRPDDGGLAPPAGASGSEAFALLAWLARPTFDDEQEEVIVLPMVAGRFRRAQCGLDGSDQAK